MIWDLLKTHIFPRTRELPQFPISPKPLFLSKKPTSESFKTHKRNRVVDVDMKIIVVTKINGYLKIHMPMCPYIKVDFPHMVQTLMQDSLVDGVVYASVSFLTDVPVKITNY
ncbi:hypothetical protein LXL04_026110 [Taraxacum kok-saghyz]